jgi:hypothetical protein
MRLAAIQIPEKSTTMPTDVYPSMEMHTSASHRFVTVTFKGFTETMRFTLDKRLYEIADQVDDMLWTKFRIWTNAAQVLSVLTRLRMDEIGTMK